MDCGFDPTTLSDVKRGDGKEKGVNLSRLTP